MVYEARIIQNGDVPVSDTDTLQILSNTSHGVLELIILI